MSAALKKWLASQKKKSNPMRKYKRSVRLKNFTGTITKLRNGQVILKGRRRK